MKQISQFVRKVYGKRWNNKKYEYYLKEVFKVDERKKMKELSTGMRVKYFLALELARQPKLLLLDEPTSGLDPIIREEVLQILENLCKTEKVTILFSSHITEDIEKIGERVIYIDNGVILLNEEKEKIKSEYIKIPKAAYQGVEKKAVALRDYYLIENSQVTLPDTIQKEPAMLSEVLYFLKEKTNVSSDIKRF